nr:hypothetical protein [Tanacetum cinerariifolium]
PHQDQSPFNQNFLQQPITNPEDIMDPTTAMNMALALMAKAFKLNYSTPTKNNQRISSNLKNRQIAQRASPAPHQDQSPFNQNFLQQPMTNPEDITDPTTAMNMALALMAKAFKLNYSTPTNNNQRISSNPRNRQIAQPGMNMGQDSQMQMIGGNGGNQFRQYARNLNRYNDVQNVRNQNIGNQNGLIGVQGNGIQNKIRNGNLVAARTEGNAAGQNANQIRLSLRILVWHKVGKQ